MTHYWPLALGFMADMTGGMVAMLVAWDDGDAGA
jgi:hypothetical protein